MNLENYFNEIPYDEINNKIPDISKQLLCYLYNCYSARLHIKNNLNKLNINVLMLLTNFMNGDDLYNLLKKIEFEKKTFILSNFNNDLIILLSDIIDRKMDKLYFDTQNEYKGIYIEDIILIKIVNMFICLILSPKNRDKLNKI